MTTYDLEVAFLRALAKSRQGTSVTDAAVKLGVTRETLSRVLHGHRSSLRLLRRFLALKEEGMP